MRSIPTGVLIVYYTVEIQYESCIYSMSHVYNFNFSITANKVLWLSWLKTSINIFRTSQYNQQHFFISESSKPGIILYGVQFISSNCHFSSAQSYNTGRWLLWLYSKHQCDRLFRFPFWFSSLKNTSNVQFYINQCYLVFSLSKKFSTFLSTRALWPYIDFINWS